MRPLAVLVIAVAALAATVFAIRGCGEEDARRGATDDEIAGAARTATSPAAAEPDARRERRPRTRTAGQSAAEDDADAPPPPPEGLTTGVVRLPSGDPVAGAFVAIGDIDTSDATTVTDARGCFAIDHRIDLDRVTAFAVLDGVQHYGGSGDGRFFSGGDVTVTPVPPTDPFRIVRIVGHDGGAVSTARVQRVRGEVHDLDSPIQSAMPGGIFLIRPARSEDPEERHGFVVTEAVDAEGRPLPYGPALVELYPWDDVETTVRLPPGASVVGRAEGPDGTPLARVVVRCSSRPPDGHDTDHMAPIWDARTRTAADGSFRFDGLAPGPVTIRIPAERMTHAGGSATAVVGVATPVVVRCDALIPILMRVVGEDGLPLSEIEVYESRTAQPSRTGADGIVPLMPFARDAGGMPLRSGAPSVIVDGGPAFETVHVELSPGASAQTVQLRRVEAIRGFVLGPDGLRAPGVPVAIDRSPTRRVEWPNGRFWADGVPRSEPVVLSVPGPRGTWLDTTLPPGATRAEDVVLRIADPGEVLAVYAADLSAPLPISIRHNGTEIARIDNATALEHFALGADVDRVDVQVGPVYPGRFAFLRDVAPRGFVRVELAEGAAARGRVTTAEGHPVPYAAIVATTEAGFRTSVKAAREGTFHIPGLPTGRVKLSAVWRGRRGHVVADAPGEDIALVID